MAMERDKAGLYQKAMDAPLVARTALKEKTSQVKTLTDQASVAEAELGKANDAVAAVTKIIAEQTAAADKFRAARQIAMDASAKAKIDSAAADKAIAPKIEQAKTAQAQAAQARGVADAAALAVVTAKQDVVRLKVSQFFVTVYNAKQELAARQAELDQMTAAAQSAQSDLDASNAAIAAAQKELAEAPAKQKELETALANAQAAQKSTDAAAQAAQAAVAQKQSVVTQANDLVQRLAAESQKSPADKSLADAVIRSKATVEPLAASLEAAKQEAAGKSDAAKGALSSVTSAEAALAAQKLRVESLVKNMESLKQKVVALAADLPKRKAAADEAAKAVAAVKGKVDQLTAEYQKKSQEAAVSKG